MPNANDILWFKEQFHSQIAIAIRDTPFSLDMITAIACQETGFIWQTLRKKSMPLERLLELCVGDTLDSSAGRSAFPKTKADLIAKPNGQRMFEIARQALEDMAQFINGYQNVVNNPNKFCHGFGIFQYDLQFFLVDPDYFLQKKYVDFSASLEKCVEELRNGLKRIGWQHKTTLTDFEMACVAIAYNTGGFKPSKGLKQGHFNGQRFYGEEVFDFIRLSKTVEIPGHSPAPLTTPTAGNAIISLPTPVTANGPFYEVDVRESPLRLRSQPVIDKNNPTSNVIARLPDGQIVQAVTDSPANGFIEVETSLLGAHLRGFASTQFLKLITTVTEVPMVEITAAPTNGIRAAMMPRRSGSVTKRTAIAGAHSLNEADQPGRNGATAEELRAELAAIIEWLAVEKSSHLRYQKRRGATFCNIYAHDYCHLAGVYLPRVWWTPGAIERLARGEDVQEFLDRTIDEQRANDLFRWLRDFGPRFGWRQTGELNKLQTEVNQGAIGVIVARRKIEGASGHISVVVPETNDHQARRNGEGRVISPLQSQAGVRNFSYGTGSPNWWLGEQFADSAFWLHA